MNGAESAKRFGMQHQRTLLCMKLCLCVKLLCVKLCLCVKCLSRNSPAQPHRRCLSSVQSPCGKHFQSAVPAVAHGWVAGVRHRGPRAAAGAADEATNSQTAQSDGDTSPRAVTREVAMQTNPSDADVFAMVAQRNRRVESLLGPRESLGDPRVHAERQSIDEEQRRRHSPARGRLQAVVWPS